MFDKKIKMMLGSKVSNPFKSNVLPDKISKNKTVCPHCKKYLGQGDSYDLMKSHVYNCNSKSGRKYADALDKNKYFNDERDYEDD